jgi:hypothetical protein
MLITEMLSLFVNEGIDELFNYIYLITISHVRGNGLVQSLQRLACGLQCSIPIINGDYSVPYTVEIGSGAHCF